MEKFVRDKVAIGEYETASEVVRDGLRLLRQRDEVWKNEASAKIKAGSESIRAGRTYSPEQVRKKMSVFKKKWLKAQSSK